MVRVTLSAVLAMAASAAVAQDYSWMPREADIEKQVGQYLDASQRKGAALLGEEVLRQSEEHRKSETAERARTIAKDAKKRFDQAADAALEQRKAALMEFLGYEADEPSGLYYLVTWEMPIELLRAYAREARWSGGQLVFKGIPPGKNVVEHISQDFVRLSEKDDPVGAPASIDPRLFEMFSVQIAPTIVLHEDVRGVDCDAAVPLALEQPDGQPPLPYKGCSPLASGKWWKVAGNVSTQWALEKMASAGSVKASERLDKFKAAIKAYRPDVAKLDDDGRTVMGPSGEWHQALTTEELLKPLQSMQEAQGKSSPWRMYLKEGKDGNSP